MTNLGVAGRSARLALPLRRGELRGTISIEMLLVLIPVLFTFLGVIQLALLQVGQMVVAHAAGRAVRSAVVVLDDHPDHYSGAGRNDLAAGAAKEAGGLTGFLGDVNDDYSGLFGGGEVLGGARLSAIREPAYHALSVLGPNLSALTSALSTTSSKGEHPNLHNELGGLAFARLFFAYTVYNRGAASISVRTTSGGSVKEAGPREGITVRVNYLMPCGVPLVAPLICVSGGDLTKARFGLPSSERAQRVIGALSHVASPVVRDAFVMSGGRYFLLSAEATLPNQGAEYH